MTLEMTSPWALLALASLPLLLYYARRSLVQASPARRATSLTLRAVALLLAVAALSGLRYHAPTARQCIIVGTDASRSVSSASAQKAAEWLESIQSQAQPGGHRVQSLTFARQPSVEAGRYPDEPDDGETNIALALAGARAMLCEGYVPRIVLMTDGNQTTGDALAVARRQNVLVDVAPMAAPASEVYLVGGQCPSVVREGVAFEVAVKIRSLGDNRGKVQIVDGKNVLAEQPVALTGGETSVVLAATLDHGARPSAVELAGFDDTIAENNSLPLSLDVAPPPRVLCIEGRPGAGKALAAALGNNRFSVTTTTADEMAPTLAEPPQHDLVVLVNVPAAAVDSEQAKSLDRFVRGGGGLLVVGGDRSFTPGGYRNSPLEALLPLQAEAKSRPKSTLALVLVIDVSQSMQGAAMELARQATRQAVERLTPGDRVGVLVFHDDARWASPLGPAGDKRAILEQIAGMTAGGRTNLYPAMRRAHLALREDYADRKHVLLLSDGLSDPADFAALAGRMADDEITVSTVALGDEAAQSLLEEMAATTGGQFYYCRDADSLPRVFANEAATATLLGINDEPFHPQPGESAVDMPSGIDPTTMPTLMAFAETRARPQAAVWLTAGPGEPLLAVHALDRGRVAAFTSDVEPRWAAAWLRWPQFDAFWTQVARHVARPLPSSAEALVPGYPAELRIEPTNVALLREIAAVTGGRFDPRLDELFASTGQSARWHIALWPWLLGLAALLYVADVALGVLWPPAD